MNEVLVIGTVLAWLAIFAGAWLCWQLLRQNGRLLLRLEELEKRLDTLEFGEDNQPTGLPVGAEAPAFELQDLAGEHKSLAQYRGRSLLLIFFNPACGYCRELLPKLVALSPSPPLEERAGERRPFDSKALLLVISAGDAETNRQLFNQHQLAFPVLLQKE